MRQLRLRLSNLCYVASKIEVDMIPSQFLLLIADPDADKLVITTAVPVDDQFYATKQLRWGAALGKLLVANGTSVSPLLIRNADLSFYSKRKKGGTVDAFVGVGSDTENLYYARSVALYKASLAEAILAYDALCNVAGLRMIDASGDPRHVYVTSINAADGHGVRMVTKSTMAVTGGGTPVQILATGTGDNQFTNPLGILYVATNADSGFLYVCEATRICKIAVVTTAGSESFTWNTSYAIAANDLAWDGTNFYVQSSTQTIKYDNVFTDATKVATACVGYSITHIPDQGDGYGATLAIVDSTNSHLERRKCSDLTKIGSDVGTAGDGSTSLFDPTFTTSVATRVEYKFDDGFSYVTPSSTSHALSWNGFAGYSFRSAGPHKCTITVRGGLGLVTGIDCNTDAIAIIKNMQKMANVTSIYAYLNQSMVVALSSFSRGAAVFIVYADTPPVHGIYGNVSDLPPLATNIQIARQLDIIGSLADFPASAQTIYAYFCAGISAGSIAHLLAIRDLRIYSMWPTLSAAESVDIVINSMWTARAAYTYVSGPSCQIGGTNPDPTGNIVAPIEGTDWHEDAPGHWTPLTPGAKIYDLLNDVNSEGFNTWTAITTT